MAGTPKCANCGSRNTLALVNNVNCLDCGALTDWEGNRVASGIDATGRAVIEQRLAPREPGEGVTGNLADLQRAGSPTGPDTVGEAAAESVPGQQAEAEIEAGTTDPTEAPKKATKKK